ATFGNSRSAAEVRKALNASERVVRQGAILGVLSGNGSPDAALALESLRALAVSPDVDDRLAACRVSREVSGPQVLPLLIHLMRDRAVVVRQAALQASASHDDADLLKPLLEATDDPATGRVAERALVAHGPRSIAVLAEGLDQGDDRSITRRQLLSTARILGRIQGRPSLELLRSMMTSRDEELKLEALKSLSRLCYRAESSEQIAAHLHDEVEYAAWLAAARDNLQHVGSPAAWNILANALDISFRDARSRILLFLSFLYDRTAVLRAKGALDHPSATNAPMALETIDALLPSAMKTWILPLMENAALGDAVRRWRLAGIEIADASPGSLLRSLISVGSGARHASWARLCALHVAGRTGERGLTSELEAIATGDDPALAAMAHWALNRFSAATAPVGGARMLSLVEKVLILKSAPLFAETPDNVLAEVAGLVEEVSFDADQVIFKKGEAGDSLYVIVSGSVKVWDGERLLNELGEGEVFGELALLDPEPRLATVKCAEPTSLLRLDAPHFREVLDSQPEVSAAIIRVITRYLRSQLQFAREATAKLRALESFTPLDQHAVG
ncbi:MAG TPA: cyclic nucleotide-binding domain-containing protein, partial [Anaerolineales bacterium]